MHAAFQQACDGGYSFSQRPDHLISHPLGTCAPFDREFQVAGIQGHMMGDGGAAHDAVREACADGADVALTDGDGELVATVSCTTELAPAPAWLAIVE